MQLQKEVISRQKQQPVKKCAERVKKDIKSKMVARNGC